jgi:hypothetical protein
MSESPEDLRRQAAAIREEAKYKDRGYGADLILAAELERKAAALECRDRLQPGPSAEDQRIAQERSEAARKARVDKAIQQMLNRLGLKS